MDKWFEKISSWFQGLLFKIFDAFVGFLHDIFMWVVHLVLDGIASLLSAIPAPSFMQNNSIGSIINDLSPFALYVANHMGIANAFLIILAGITFRLTRKFFTLGQW